MYTVYWRTSFHLLCTKTNILYVHSVLVDQLSSSLYINEYTIYTRCTGGLVFIFSVHKQIHYIYTVCWWTSFHLLCTKTNILYVHGELEDQFSSSLYIKKYSICARCTGGLVFIFSEHKQIFYMYTVYWRTSFHLLCT